MAGRERTSIDHDRILRKLLGRATEKKSLRSVVRNAGIDTNAGYMQVYRWFHGRESTKGDLFPRPFKGQARKKLIRHLKKLLSEDSRAIGEIEYVQLRQKLERLAKVATWVPSDGTREWFARILEDNSCERLSRREIRAGHYCYAPDGGLSEPDYEAFAWLMDNDDREELRRLIDQNKE